MNENEERSRRRRNVALVLLVIVVLIIILLLSLMRGCAPPDGFNYLRAKASELGNDPARIVAFVRDECATLEARGDVKGALGTLWNGAGSPEEKKALAEALLPASRKPASVSLDDVAPGRAKDQDAAAPAAPFTLTISHRVLLGETAPRETQVWKGPAGEVVGDVHTIETPQDGVTRFTLRAGADLQKDVDVSGASGEELVLTVERAGATVETTLLATRSSPPCRPATRSRRRCAAARSRSCSRAPRSTSRGARARVGPSSASASSRARTT